MIYIFISFGFFEKKSINQVLRSSLITTFNNIINSWCTSKITHTLSNTLSYSKPYLKFNLIFFHVHLSPIALKLKNMTVATYHVTLFVVVPFVVEVMCMLTLTFVCSTSDDIRSFVDE
jgi:hypothetical protein